MITVRFPTGLKVQYNDAAYVEYHNIYGQAQYRIMDKEGGRLYALVPMSSGALIEFTKPCVATMTSGAETNQERIQWLIDHGRSMAGWGELGLLADFKKMLHHFDARARTWKK